MAQPWFSDWKFILKFLLPETSYRFNSNDLKYSKNDSIAQNKNKSGF